MLYKINLISRETLSGSNRKCFCLIIDKKLSFHVHIKALLKRASQKQQAAF